jgi:hypothetical protein
VNCFTASAASDPDLVGNERGEDPMKILVSTVTAAGLILGGAGVYGSNQPEDAGGNEPTAVEHRVGSRQPTPSRFDRWAARAERQIEAYVLSQYGVAPPR